MTIVDYARTAGRPYTPSLGAFHDPDPDSFGHVLWMLRERRGWSRNRLALEVGVNPSYLSRTEHGSREPPRRYIVIAITRVLGLPPADANRLLVAGGHAPHIAEWTDMHQRITDVIDDGRIPDEDKRAFCETVERLAEQWRRNR